MTKLRKISDFEEFTKHLDKNLFNIKNITAEYSELKNWGFKYNLFTSTTISVDLCWMVQGGVTSWHVHDYKYNVINVVSGKLKIERATEHPTNQIKIIGPNEDYRRFEIQPGYYHSITALENTVFIEIDHVKCQKEDIIRTDEGGILNG